MPQRDIIPAQLLQGAEFKGKMILVAAVQQQNMPLSVLRAGKVSAYVAAHLFTVIAETADIQVPLGKMQHFRVRRRNEENVFRKNVLRHGAAGTKEFVIARDQHHLGQRQLREEIVGFFQFCFRRRPVKKIPGNQKKIHGLLIADFNQTGQRIPYGVGPCGAPGFIPVRHGTQMQISCMNKAHSTPQTFLTIKYSTRKSAPQEKKERRAPFFPVRSAARHLFLFPAALNKGIYDGLLPGVD